MHAPLLATGEFAVGAMQKIGHASQLGAFEHAARVGIVAGGQTNQFTHAQGGRQLCVLQHHSDLAPCGDVLRVVAEQFHAASIGADQPQQQANRGGFACAIGTKQGQQFTVAQFQIETVECAQWAVVLADTVQPCQCGVCNMSHRSVLSGSGVIFGLHGRNTHSPPSSQ